MDKEILIKPFSKTSVPEYTCPRCYRGVLRLDGDFYSHETVESASYHNEEWWDPEYVELIFNCRLKCSSCHDYVFMVGNGVVQEENDVDPYGEWSRDWVSYFRPTYFHPPLQVIDYPAKASGEVLGPLTVAGAALFTSPGLACNAIRTSAEEVLTYLGVPVKDGEKFITFGNRINLLPEEKGSIKKLFSAIRWIGNHGSHPGEIIEFEDALHAFEIVEFLLEEVFGDRRQTLEDLAAAINDRKGPVGRLYKPRGAAV